MSDRIRMALLHAPCVASNPGSTFSSEEKVAGLLRTCRLLRLESTSLNSEFSCTTELACNVLLVKSIAHHHVQQSKFNIRIRKAESW